MMDNNLREDIFRINSFSDFEDAAFRVMKRQVAENPLYRSFTGFLNRKLEEPGNISEIPFLPVELFRNHPVITGEVRIEMIFESSGTSGMIPGKHFIRDLSLYEESFLRTFRMFYGDPGDYIIAALLPSYLERSGSSLVYMADKLIHLTSSGLSGFYRNNPRELIRTIDRAKKTGSKILLIGVSFALLDLAEEFSPDLSGVMVMETGGMKGRRKELTRNELHDILKEKFNIDTVHSEYGMTELLSQAYSKKDGIFYCPPWMRILLRDPHDPLKIITEPGKTGGINIIDLANMHSCAFIATSDLGRLHNDGGFEVLGRFDNSDIRGCNLLIG